MSIDGLDNLKRSEIYCRRAFAYHRVAELALCPDSELVDLYEPLLQLQCQSLEIGLKAYLLAQGTSFNRISKLKHNLKELFRRAVAAGLYLDYDDLRVTFWMHTAYMENAMRYGPLGKTVSLQHPRSFHGALTRILEQISHQCSGEAPYPVSHLVDPRDVDMHLNVFTAMYQSHIDRFESTVGPILPKS